MPTLPKKLLLLLSLAFLASPARAQQNPYDIVGKVLLPFAKIFIPAARTQNHALTAVLTLDEATGLPADAAGQTLEVAIQSPDKLRLHTTLAGQEITLCRNGDDVWAFPGSKIDAIISAQTDSLPPENPNFKLPSFRLPLTEKQLVFLPILFQVQDAGSADVAGESCRVLDLVLMPELARALKAQDWTARLWVGPENHLAKVQLTRGDKWHAVISIKKLEYVPSLPDETWQPSTSEASDVLKLTPGRYGQLFGSRDPRDHKVKNIPPMKSKSPEKIFFIETKHARLAAVLHEASGNKLAAPGSKLVIISHGYTGNKQESARLFVTMARTLAEQGINALRFDFMGSGDSSGEFYEMSPNTEIRDLLDVIAWARKKKYRDIGLIGLSFGGAVSICASAKSPDVKTLVTWSAVPGFADWRPAPDERFSKTSPNPMKPGKVFYTDRPKIDVPQAYCSLLIPKLQIQGDNDLPGFREEFAFFFPRAKGIKKHIVIPKADHTFTTWPHRKRVLAATLAWFQKYL